MTLIRFTIGLLATSMILANPLTRRVGQAQTEQAFFARALYPILVEADCRECHNDNGVASETKLRFPPEDATAEEITRFGLSLLSLIDAENIEQSLLWRKPTKRMEHTGGELVPPGSKEEKVLRAWIEYLSKYGGTPVTIEAKDRKPPVVLRRLTHSQYDNTLRNLLGNQTRPSDQFPAEDYLHGFANQAAGQSVSPLLVMAWNQAAGKAAHLAFLGGDRRGLIPGKATTTNDTTRREQFIRQFGQRAFRRPLNDSEVHIYDRLFVSQVESEREFEDGARAVVEAMLQSPHFLFHLEGGDDGQWPGYRVASRLSYFLWNTMPDERLFQAAAKGELSTQEGVERQTRRMLADPRARDAFNEFLAQWLRFDRLRSAVRDRRLFPEFTAELVHDMTEEVRRLFEHLVWDDGNFLEFYTADYAFLSSQLARLYEVSPPPEEFGRVRFSKESERGGGILGSGLFLSLTSKPSDTSPTERGLFVREHFLCQHVPPPPPGVDTTLPANTAERPQSNRERLKAHLSDSNCASCHNLIDPIGYGLERFDAIGRYRSKHIVTVFPTREELRKDRNKKPRILELEIDVRASIRGIADSQFNSPKQLGEVLAASPSCRRCVVKQLFRYAMGRLETEADQSVIDTAMRDFETAGFRFQELILSIVKSKLFLGDTER